MNLVSSVTRFFAAVALLFSLSGLTSASITSITIVSEADLSTSGIGAFEATLTYEWTSSTEATISVSLKNLATDNGKITAFAFNNPFNSIGGLQGSVGDSFGVNLAASNFDLFGEGSSFNNGIAAPPFQHFDIGAGLVNGGGSENFNGGGSPNGGILTGQTGEFTFEVSGTGLDLLTANSFADAFSEGGNGSQSAFFLVRFRGFDSGGSDKTVGGEVPPNFQTSTPEPATIAIWSTIGVAGLAFPRLRRRVRR